jgi:hypothetical protein
MLLTHHTCWYVNRTANPRPMNVPLHIDANMEDTCVIVTSRHVGAQPQHRHVKCVTVS